MSKIRIERFPIQVKNLGKFGADHLWVTFQQDELDDDGDTQHRWYVMEGTVEGSSLGGILGVDGADGRTSLAAANDILDPVALRAHLGSPASRGSLVLPLLDTFNAWSAMAAIARDIDQLEYPYYATSGSALSLPISNSTSVIASLLYYVGLDIQNHRPQAAFYRFTAGTHTLLGTSDDQSLSLEGHYDTILSGDGDDKLEGRDGLTETDKFYGGLGNDEIKWSKGVNYIHGGQPVMPYEDDGTDLVDYTGVGIATFNYSKALIPDLVPDFTVVHSNGTDFLFSIERLRWSETNDQLVMGKGIELLKDKSWFQFFDQSPGTDGDIMDFSREQSGLLYRPSDEADIALVQGGASPDDHSGLFVESLETLIGSAGNDRIYASSGLFKVDSGEGDDLLDGRGSAEFSGLSIQGYDIEIYGGEGDDTIISGSGRSLATGGAGADRFVLANLTNGLDRVEFVIEDADATDQLLVPYNFLDPYGGPFEGSRLFPLLGALAASEDYHGYGDIPEVAASGSAIDTPGAYQLQWQTQTQDIFEIDATVGVLPFAVRIYYTRDGGDLLIHVVEGAPEEYTFTGSDESEHTAIDAVLLPQTEAVIRVKDFNIGDLGIHFCDYGTATPFDFTNFQGPGGTVLWSNYDAAVRATMNNGVLIAPLEERPDDVIFDFDENGPGSRPERNGTDGDDLIIASATSRLASRPSGFDLFGKAGNDTLTGSDGRDKIDGGAGGDRMTGLSGNDTFIIDNAGDVVVEQAGGGFDTVRSSISFTLGAHVEDLVLTGAGTFGRGNALRNSLSGTGKNDRLEGLAGDDSLYGAGGNDVLVGGTGNDAFVYLAATGTDTIIDTGAATDADTLYLRGVAKSQVSVARLAIDLDDVAIRITGGGRVILDEFLAGASADRIEFDDGRIWGRATITALAQQQAPLTNDKPVAVKDLDFYTSSRRVVITAADLLANDSDADNHLLSVVAASSKTAGVTVGRSANGDLVFTAAKTFIGSADFTYSISDGHGGFALANGALTFLSNGTPALARSPLVDQESLEDTRFTYTIPEFTFLDPDGQELTYSATLANGVRLPAWINFNPTTLTFSGTPPKDFNGTLSLRVTASDGEASIRDTFTLTIEPVNDRPLANSDTGIATAFGTAASISTSRLLANDRDADGDLLKVTAVSAAVNGTVSLDATGHIIFTPKSGYAGAASFGYTISDGHGGTSTARAHITITPDTSGEPNRIDGTRKPDKLTGTADADIISGYGGKDRISGLAGADIIDGGRGGDSLSGGAGNDVFVFRPKSGSDRIVDFTADPGASGEQDRLDLTAFDFADFAEVRAHARADGDSTVLSFGFDSTSKLAGMTSVRLIGVALQDFDAQDVIL